MDFKTGIKLAHYSPRGWKISIWRQKRTYPASLKEYHLADLTRASRDRLMTLISESCEFKIELLYVELSDWSFFWRNYKLGEG